MWLNHGVRRRLRDTHPRAWRTFLLCWVTPQALVLLCGLAFFTALLTAHLTLLFITGAALILSLFTLPLLMVASRRVDPLIFAQREDPTWCRRCGYDIDEFQRCPECGTPRGTAARWHWTDLLLITSLILLPIALFAAIAVRLWQLMW